VLLSISTGAYFYFHRTPKLTDKDRIVLAEFQNKTGDSVFDDTLRQGLVVQLEQSPFLSLVPDQRIQRTLGLMNQPSDTRLSGELARGVCERTGSAAVVEGSIASLGSSYVLNLRQHWRDSGRGAGAGGSKRRRVEYAESNGRHVQDACRRIALRGRKA
jgi:hypothetical protein